jgi:hypothetical protein
MARVTDATRWLVSAPYHDGTVQLNVASGSAVIITLGSD